MHSFDYILYVLWFRNCPGSVTSTLDANKYKLLMRIPLEDLEIMKGTCAR